MKILNLTKYSANKQKRKHIIIQEYQEYLIPLEVPNSITLKDKALDEPRMERLWQQFLEKKKSQPSTLLLKAAGFALFFLFITSLFDMISYFTPGLSLMTERPTLSLLSMLLYGLTIITGFFTGYLYWKKHK